MTQNEITQKVWVQKTNADKIQIWLHVSSAVEKKQLEARRYIRETNNAAGLVR